jgi:hypothetical protein
MLVFAEILSCIFTFQFIIYPDIVLIISGKIAPLIIITTIIYPIYVLVCKNGAKQLPIFLIKSDKTCFWLSSTIVLIHMGLLAGVDIRYGSALIFIFAVIAFHMILLFFHFISGVAVLTREHPVEKVADKMIKDHSSGEGVASADWKRFDQAIENAPVTSESNARLALIIQTLKRLLGVR